ncbi:MAG TPA: hypothetical protein VFT95_01215 [Micromonosporaceae bacterium]|nr:hypothetical protein [Micromonosporaceae bacterium]
MLRTRAGAPSRARRIALAALVAAVTASVTTVAGMAAAEDAATVTTKAAAAEWESVTQVTALSRRTDWVDVFWVGDEGYIRYGSRDPATGDWRTGFLKTGIAAPNTKITGVSRYPGRLDLFAVGTDHKVYTAYLDEDLNGRGTVVFHGWFLIDGVTVDDGTSVSAVSNSRGRMELFTVGTDHRVNMIRWTSGAGWGTWQWIDDGQPVVPINRGGEVTAAWAGVWLHVFVETRYMDGPFLANAPATNRYSSGTGWVGWDVMDIDVEMMLGSEISVTPRGQQVDIFVNQREADGKPRAIQTATWNSTQWSALRAIPNNGRAQVATSVVGAARGGNNLDAFHVGRDNKIYTAAWTPQDGWNGWWDLGGEVGSLTSPAAISRNRDLLDIFVFGKRPNDLYPIYTRRWSPSTGWSDWENVAP